MTLQNVRITRLTIGVTTVVAASYGVAWPLSFVSPIFAALFLTFPAWIGWKMAFQLMGRLIISLFIGLVLSEFFLGFPLLCVPLYALIFFSIYYNDTPTSPPMATLFMTLGVTMVPIMGLSGAEASHAIAMGLLVNMGCGLFFAWIFHMLIPNSLAEKMPQAMEGKKSPPPAPSANPSDQERARLALVSTLVALAAVMLFFAFNLSQYSLAMMYICFAAGTPSTVASLKVMKANTLATCIGGIAIIVAFNLLVAVPTYLFLLALVLTITLFFAGKIFIGGPYAASFSSGYTTFLVLLGSSTGVDQIATTNFYLRIGQVLFAGLFTVVALRVIEHLLRPRTKRRLLFKNTL